MLRAGALRENIVTARAATHGIGVSGDVGATVRVLAPEPTVLSVYVRLIGAFTDARVEWCYWKSSRRAPEALAGRTDLDILVAPASQHDARRVLLECGFRLFLPVGDRAELAVESYLSYDQPTGRIAHVDLHTRLTLGTALFKTHRLPWEDSLIGHAAPQAGLALPVLDPACEAVLLLVRACFELRRRDPVVARNWGRLTNKFSLDRAQLASRVDREVLRARAAQLLDERSAAALADAWLDPRPLHQQRELRRRVRRATACFRTCSRIESSLRGLWRGLLAAFDTLNKRALRWPRPWNRRVAGGGIVVAVIAVDGAGKSTLVRGVCDWLGGHVDVLPLYFGTGDGRPSWFLAPLKALAPIAARLLPRKPRGSSHGPVTDGTPGLAYGVSMCVWASVLALEKRVKLRTAHRAANRGMVVITDRFPQDQIFDFNDGPLLPHLRGIPRWLRAFEASAYALARELRPDLVLKLVASPELIAAREPTMDPGVIRARTSSVERLTFGGAPVIAISASQPAAEVLHAAKVAIWRAL
jgi:hypothetical protein